MHQCNIITEVADSAIHTDPSLCLPSLKFRSPLETALLCLTCTNCCLRVAVCLIFYSVKVESSHFAPNYFAVNLSDGSCRAVLIQHVTLNLFIDTSKEPAQFSAVQLWHLYDVTEAACHFRLETFFPLSLPRSPETLLPSYTDLFQDGWHFVKYIISTHVILPSLFFFFKWKVLVQQMDFQFACHRQFVWTVFLSKEKNYFEQQQKKIETSSRVKEPLISFLGWRYFSVNVLRIVLGFLWIIWI